MKGFSDWCEAVMAQVRFWPDRRAIRRELTGHYEDHRLDLERIGYKPDLAAERALQAMGDPVEVGKGLDRAHKPWLGWLWLGSTLAMLVCLAAAVWSLQENPLYLLADIQDTRPQRDYEAEGLLAYQDLEAGEDSFHRERIAVSRGMETVTRCGYTMEVPYAALWEGPEGIYWLSAVVTAEDRRFWDAGPDLKGLTMVTSSGLTYGGLRSADDDPDGRFLGCSQWGSTFFRATYRIQRCLHEFPVEWVELTYPYGEPWTIRIEWEEEGRKE